LKLSQITQRLYMDMIIDDCYSIYIFFKTVVQY